MADDETLELRKKICQDYLADQTDNGWNKLQKEMKRESRLWQGVADEDAEHAVELAQREYGDTEKEIDPVEDSYFSVSDEGLWVSGWFWVSQEELGWLPDPDEDIELDEETLERINALDKPSLIKLLHEELSYENLEQYTAEQLRTAVAQLMTAEKLTEGDVEEYLD